MDKTNYYLEIFLKNYELTSGIYKGQKFYDTPTTYQTWLMNQNWFFNLCSDYVNESINDESMLCY
jgi:uncharacterized protein (DUF3820 family)